MPINSAQIERRHAGADVDNGAAREVERAAAPGRDALECHARMGEDAAAPDPMAKRTCKRAFPTGSGTTTIALNFIRSAKAPQISAGVMMKNMP